MDSGEDETLVSPKVNKIYLLAITFLLVSTIHWCLLVNLESFKFLLNEWMITAALITFIFIMTLFTVADCVGKRLPLALDWIFGVALVEILVIALSIKVIRVDGNVLYISICVIVSFMTFLTVAGAHIFKGHLFKYVLGMFSLNIIFVSLVFTLPFIARVAVKWYTIVFYIISAIAYPILIMNVLYISMLINHDRYEIKTLTDCLKPALYIYSIFASFLWFTLSLVIEIWEAK